MIDLKNILLATDFTRFTLEARQLARDLCRRFGAKLHLLHVINDRPQNLPDAVGRLFDENSDVDERHTHQEEQAVVKLWEELFPNYRKDHDVEFATRFGHPVHEVVEYAREKNIDLIVVGTHGRTGVDHFVGGSVAEEIVRKAPCPVLTAHAPPAPQTLEVAIGISRGKSDPDVLPEPA